MGCAQSVPVVETPPEPLPTWEALQKIRVERQGAKEPSMAPKNNNNNDSGASVVYDDFSPLKECTPFIFRQILEGNKGNSFQLEGLEDALFHELRIDPAKPGIGIKKRLEDLVYLHQESDDKTVIGYAMKNVPQGLNHYLIMRSQPLHSKQKPIDFTPNSPFGDMYTYATLEFDVKAKIGRIRYSFNLNNVAKGEPSYTLHQCNPKVWVLKRNYENGPQISAVFNQWRGLAKFTCWRLAICAGEDPLFVSLVAHCIDSFMHVANGQFWKLHPAGVPPQDLDWPPLPEGMEDKLFGHKARFWS